MTSLEELFTTGTISGTADVKGVKFHIVLLNSEVLQQALNAIYASDPTAYALESKKQILARAITNINGNVTISDVDKPTQKEVAELIAILNKLHYSIINKIFEVYNKLDDSASEGLEDEIKK